MLCLWAVFAAVALFVYAPALGGDFISDDEHYVENNPYVHDFTEPDNFIAIWDPSSIVTILVENYAPVHLVLHGIEWAAFGPEVTGYHVVNVVLHALASALLWALFVRSGISSPAALLGSALFLVHPANVESVAWISQLKSSSSLVLALLAVLAHPRRPGWACACFALALFAKPFAAVALFAVALFGWVRSAPAEGRARVDWRWRWLGGWCAVLALFALAEVVAFRSTAGQVPALYDETLTRVLMMGVVAVRYVVMSLFGWGLSIFHEPAPASGVLDPWVVAAAFVLAGLAARLVLCLRARNEEAVYWLWALVSFAPLSGVVPLPYPLADRYLYFMLPGLIGAALLAAPELGRRLADALPARLDGRVLGRSSLALGAVWVCVFAAQAHERAAIWQSAETMMADAELHYPDGAAANTRKAGRAAREGDFERAVRHLEAAHARGYNRLDHILSDPSYGPMQDYPPFVDLKHRMARDWTTRLGASAEPSQVEARALAQALIVLDDLEAALAVVEAAAERPGPIEEDLRGDAVKLRAEIARRQRFERLRESRAPEP